MRAVGRPQCIKSRRGVVAAGSGRRGRGDSGRLSGIGLAAVVALLAVGWSSPGEAGTTGPPVASWLQDMRKTFAKAKKALQDASNAVAAGDMVTLDYALDRAVANIDQILEPGVYPDLDPPDAGWTDPSIEAETLLEYAEVTLQLAESADAELATGEGFDNDFVGTELRTIKHLITRFEPHNYRSIAGLDD